MLNLLTAVLDLGQSKSGGGTFEEVAQRGKLVKVSFLAVVKSVRFDGGCRVSLTKARVAYRAVSIFLKVVSACSKKP